MITATVPFLCHLRISQQEESEPEEWVKVSMFRWLREDCSNSSALAMQLLQFCTKPSICSCSVYSYNVMRWQCFRHYCSVMRGNHRWLVDSSHKGLVMWSYGDSFLVSLNKLLNRHSSCQWFEMPCDAMRCRVTSLQQCCAVLPKCGSTYIFGTNMLWRWLIEIVQSCLRFCSTLKTLF